MRRVCARRIILHLIAVAMSSNGSQTIRLHTDLPITALRQRVRELFAGDIPLGTLDPAGTQYFGAFTDHWFRLSRSRVDKVRFPDLVGRLRPGTPGTEVVIEFNPSEEAIGMLMMLFCIGAPIVFALAWAFVIGEGIWAFVASMAVVGVMAGFGVRMYRSRVVTTSERFHVAVEEFARFIEAVPAAKSPLTNGDARSLHIG